MNTAPHAQLPGELLDHAHCGLALLDEDKRLSWLNATFAQLVESEASSLLGLAPEELPQKASQLLFGEATLVNLHSGGQQRWLRRDVHAQDHSALLVIQDVTEEHRLDEENKRLRQQVEDLKLNDDLTGLPNKRAITQALDLQISRSRRYQNPLSVVLVHVGLNDEQISTLQTGVEPLVLGVSRYLRDRLRWVDQIGRWEDNIFILVLPETGQEETDGLVEKIRNEQATMLLPEPFDKVRPSLSFGTAYWQKGDDMRTLLRHANEQLAAD